MSTGINIPEVRYLDHPIRTPMKELLLTFLLPTVVWYSAFTQNTQYYLTRCLRNGYIMALGGLFEKEVELTLFNKTERLEAKEAELQLRSFYRDLTLKGFTTVHSHLKKESGYLIGILETAEKHYNIHILLHQQNKKLLIHKIRIEYSDE